MAALTQTTIVKHREPAHIVSVPVAATEVIYQGALVALDSSGYAVPAAPAASTKFAGIAAEEADNATGGDADISVSVFVSGLHHIPISGLAVTDGGKKVYAETDNPADAKDESDTPTTNAQKIGVTVAVEGSDAIVDISNGVTVQELAT